MWFPKVTQCLNVALKLDILKRSQVLFFSNLQVSLKFFAPNQKAGPCDQPDSLTWVSSPSPKGLQFLQNSEIISRKIEIWRQNCCICRILSMSIPLRFLSKPVLVYESFAGVEGHGSLSIIQLLILGREKAFQLIKKKLSLWIKVLRRYSPCALAARTASQWTTWSTAYC